MATGKSVIGMQLAKTLNLSYVDTDKLIEGETGENIPTLFKKHGEAYFRKLEKKIIKGLADGNKRVISTGGGTVLDPENMDLLKSLGVIIHLSSPASTILSRTKMTLKSDPSFREITLWSKFVYFSRNGFLYTNKLTMKLILRFFLSTKLSK